MSERPESSPSPESPTSKPLRWQFDTTRWSLVLAAGELDASPEASAALTTLCQAYWPPLYAFARRSGQSTEDARDLTQGFFAHLIERNAIARADAERGRFRSFLLTAFKHFMFHEWEKGVAKKRGGGLALVSFDDFDSDERYAIEPADPASPERLFDQEWALRQIEQALARLRQEYAEAKRGALFDLLKDYVWGESSHLTLAEVALELDLTEEAVKKAVQRLRARFRDCLRTELAQTVATPDQIDAELRHLRAALIVD